MPTLEWLTKVVKTGSPGEAQTEKLTRPENRKKSFNKHRSDRGKLHSSPGHPPPPPTLGSHEVLVLKGHVADYIGQ